MSLSDLAALGSFVSGVAVLVSLVFLYFQLRQLSGQVEQAEKNQRAALNQGYITRTIEGLRWSAQSSVNELIIGVETGDTTFTAEELRCLRLAFRSAILNLQDAFLQHQAGLVDTMTFDNSRLALMGGWFSRPVGRALWMQLGSTIAPEFRSVIDAMIRETPISKPLDHVTRFNADLATVTSAAAS